MRCRAKLTLQCYPELPPGDKSCVQTVGGGGSMAVVCSQEAGDSWCRLLLAPGWPRLENDGDGRLKNGVRHALSSRPPAEHESSSGSMVTR